MIPKIIHYIWLGNNPMPEIVNRCIASWKKYCPDYQIKRHTEQDLNIDLCNYCREAYDNKKWAFASDVLRFDVLYREGGIYLDTDVELIKPLDDLLDNEFFLGFEDENFVAPGLIMGATKGNKIIEELLEEYNKRSFLKEDGTLDMTTICVYTTDKLVKYGLKLNNTTQIFSNFKVYSSDYFCPKSSRGIFPHKTKNTYSIHHYASSWKPKKTLIQRICGRIKRIVNKK